MNGFQLDKERVPSQWLPPVHAGSRTTYRQSCMTAGVRLESTRKETCLITPDHFWVNTHVDHSSACGESVRRRSEYTERTIGKAMEQGFRFVFFGRGAPYPGILSEAHGSGDVSLVAALALCESVDAVGFGLFGEGPGSNVHYLHSYSPDVGRCAARGRTRTCWLKGAAKVRKMIRREVTWSVWHVLGVLNWVVE
eukprot:3396849-Prymnesium_polylepis.1